MAVIITKALIEIPAEFSSCRPVNPTSKRRISALSIAGMVESDSVVSRASKVRLVTREELPDDWDPAADGRLTVWHVTQHLIRTLDKRGEAETATLKIKVGRMAEVARDLAYRLYTICERQGWAEAAMSYGLVVAWSSISPELFRGS